MLLYPALFYHVASSLESPPTARWVANKFNNLLISNIIVLLILLALGTTVLTESSAEQGAACDILPAQQKTYIISHLSGWGHTNTLCPPHHADGARFSRVSTKAPACSFPTLSRASPLAVPPSSSPAFASFLSENRHRGNRLQRDKLNEGCGFA